LCRHGHFQVNGRKVDIPSFFGQARRCHHGDWQNAEEPTIEHAMEEVKGRGIPSGWRSTRQNSGRVVSMPTREQINLPVQEQLIRGAVLEVSLK
jgi:small subunit ribosomal protein S4